MRMKGIEILVLISAFLAVSLGRHGQKTKRAFYTKEGMLLQELINNDGTTHFCTVYAERSSSDEVLKVVPTANRFLVDSQTLLKMAQTCHDLLLKQGILQKRRSKRGISDLLRGIYPGTKWCGKGNLATHSMDVGALIEVDTCCRVHDQCLPKVTAGNTTHGLTNTGSFTAMHCKKCDQVFYNCLKGLDSNDANWIGFTYFDLLNNKCIEEDYPEVCKSWWVVFTKCYKDKTQPKQMQFKDYPDSYGSPLW